MSSSSRSPKANPRGGSTFASIACLAVAVLGVFGAMSSYQVSENYSSQFPDAYGSARAEVRFAPVLSRIPPSAELGYFTDLEPSQPAYTPAFLAAQYAVAPRMLQLVNAQMSPEWAVGNFSKPLDFAAAGNARGYSIVADLGNGVVLYQRKP